MNSCVEDGLFRRRRIISSSSSAPGSPKSRVKFLCSHGGKILPRPSHGQLKYVGGETRVISVPLDISFQELMERLTYLIDGEMILKYQLASEDLDVLVSVKCDEDVGHMFDEMEHYQVMGYPRMRTFLFPITHLDDNPTHLPLHQRYIFSINGVVFPKHHPTTTTTTSACTSPDSSSATDTPCPSHQNNTNTNLPKIHSSPSLCNLNIIPQQYSYHQYYPNSTPQTPYHAYNQKTGLLYRRADAAAAAAAAARLTLQSSTPASISYRQLAPSSTDRNRGGSGYCFNCMHHDNCSHFLDRQGTLP